MQGSTGERTKAADRFAPASAVPDALLDALAEKLGRTGILTDPADTAPFATDWRGLCHGRTRAVLRPASTAEVADCVRLCAAARVPLVPQGGNTSMVAGAVPSDDGSELVLSLARAARVRAVDALDLTVTLEAGVTLKAAQDAAAAAGAWLPLSISSEGSAEIGGVLATNAGGNNTLRFGNARERVLGLEVVLADASVWNGLRRLRKDNTGYCLRQLFVGSEGTLGIITAAVLRLEPASRERTAAFVSLASVESALSLLARARRADPASLIAFEYLSGASLGLVLAHIEGARLPLGKPAPHYALIELASPRPTAGLARALEAVLAEALEAGEIIDATLAASEAQRAAFWKLREEHSEAQKRAGASVKNDVSVPVPAIPELLRRAAAKGEAIVPGVLTAPFGHLGDGNIHFNLVQPPAMAREAFMARSEALMEAVAEIVGALDGSFSAEHGIGRLKPPMMARWRGGPELALMRRIKAALDPAGLFNPGALLPRD
ncbi:MAG: FAD-binding oxidoreductase [Acetobacteraceae bacterium]